MGRAGLEPALLFQELGPKPSASANSATCPSKFILLIDDPRKKLRYIYTIFKTLGSISLS